MLRSLFGIDWHKSNARLLLLSKFLSPRQADDFALSESWKAALGENPKQAIKRFQDEGMLVEAGLDGRIDYKFKVTELKNLLKERGLPVSGRKNDLIQRLIQADSKGMKKTVAGLIVLLCSEQGQEVAEQFLASEESKRDKTEQQVLQYLSQRKFKEASTVVASYEAEQVFPRGIGIDWQHHNPTRDIAILNAIAQGKPRILKSLSESQLNTLRLAAGMMYLWGTNHAKEWLPPDFETNLALDRDAATRMVLFHAIHRVEVANYKDNGVAKQVEILVASDSCEACKKIAGKRFKLNDVIELPYEHCTNEIGCRCTLIAVLK